MKTHQPVEQGRMYDIAVRDLGIHGEGIGETEGFTVFVPGALPGETVQARIDTVKKSYALGTLSAVKEASPYRTEPVCPAYRRCGGCQISHLTYEGQLLAKRRRVMDTISRIAGESPELVRPVMAAPHPFGYRNKMMIPVRSRNGRAEAGYYALGSHDIAPVSSCAIQQEGNNRLLQAALAIMNRYGITGYNEKTRRGAIRHIMGRTGEKGSLMAVIITATKTLPHKEDWIRDLRKALPEMVSLYHNVQSRPGSIVLGPVLHHIWGEETLKETLCGLHFRVSPYSFFQVNQEQAQALYDKAIECCDLKGTEEVIDAYCGTGTISLCLARKAAHVTGIEVVEAAIKDARKNARKNGIANADFLIGDAGKVMPALYRKRVRPDVIVCDPVRAGCGETVLDVAAGMNPKKIVYVSCNPATLARDISRLRRHGYRLRLVQPVDMFPQTMHIECVALLMREQA